MPLYIGPRLTILGSSSPFTIATCIGRSTSVFTSCAILYAISRAIHGSPFNAMVALSFASYLSMYPLLLLPPLVLLSFDRQPEKRRTSGVIRFAFKCVVITAGCLAVLLGMSFVVTGNSWEFLARTYGIQLTLSDLTPNVGLWWYFFIEMFDSFRAFSSPSSGCTCRPTLAASPSACARNPWWF